MKKSVTMITLLLLMAGLLSGCDKGTLEEPQEDLPKVSLNTEEIAESKAEVFTAESETVETQPKFNIAKDVLLSYEYNSNGELSKVTFIRDFIEMGSGSIGKYTWEFEDFNVTYDISGYLKSIKTESVSNALEEPRVSIESEYNANGQIISLVLIYDPYAFPVETHNYEVVYNSFDDYIKVYITTPSITEDRVYDSNYNYVSFERFRKIGSSGSHLKHEYGEFTNGLISRIQGYDISSGQLEYLHYDITYYDNGQEMDEYWYDQDGNQTSHIRYNRKGEKILSE